jgi:hypothetical protein
MRHSRERVKADLLKHAEAMIDKLLDFEEQQPGSTLTKLEDEILAARQKLGQEVGAALAKEREAAQPHQAACPTCGRLAELKGLKALKVESRVGTLDLKRAHYYCPHCRKGFFPPR